MIRAPPRAAGGLAPVVALVAVVAAAGLITCAVAAPASAGTSLANLSFVDASYGWATGTQIGTDGMPYYVVARTTDGGATWTAQKKTAAFNGTGLDVQFVSRTRGIWVNSRVYLTTDGGAHWRRVTFPGAWGGGSVVDFATPSVVYVAGTQGSDGTGRSVARSGNGGRTWRTQLSQPRARGASPSALSAPTATTAYIWSHGLWATRNGGASWARVATDRAFKLNAWWQLDFPKADIGWLLRYDNRALYKTRDGGRHWAPQMASVRQHFFALDFVNGRAGWVTGAAGAVYRTLDGGATWSYQQTPTSEDLTSVDFIDYKHGWVAAEGVWGEDNALFRTADGGATWKQVR